MMKSFYLYNLFLSIIVLSLISCLPSVISPCNFRILGNADLGCKTVPPTFPKECVSIITLYLFYLCKLKLYSFIHYVFNLHFFLLTAIEGSERVIIPKSIRV